MSATTMPCLSASKINAAMNAAGIDFATADEWGQIVRKIVTGKNNRLRASKPKVDESDPITGKAAYVWRMVAFSISTKRQHWCMPCTADFDLPTYRDDDSSCWCPTKARAMAKELNILEKLIVNTVPKNQWHGITRWASAFAM